MLRTLKNLFKQDREKFVVPKSVQNVIPIKTIWDDGIFLVGRNKYAKTFKFEDINYAVASREDKEAMFLEYSELLNSLDSGATTKITINNRRLNKADFEQTILIPMADDGLDKYRKEYNKMLLDKATGANSIVQDKYVTVSVCKKNIEEARNYFARVGADLIAHFNRLGSKCVELDAGDKLRIFHDFYRTGEETAFHFDITQTMRKGHDFKDFICPDTFEFESDCFRMGDRYGRVIFLREYAAYIKDSMVAELCELNRNMMLSVDIIPVPTDEAVREVENRLLGVETNITNWQRKQNQNNNFSAVIPYDLEQQRKESKEFLDDLTTRDQRMMFAVLTMVHTADTKEQLDNDTEALLTTARKHLCQFAVLKYQQMDGLNTALPFGVRKIDALRTLTTESLSLVIILLIAPVFSGEYGGVDNIILTSKYGKTKCATAKVLASLLSAVFITTLVVIFNLLIAVAIYGTEGLDCSILFAPIDFLEGYIPFNITCGTVLKYQILLAFMSAISVTGIVLILSAVCKSQMIAFVISAAIHVIPIMLPISETSALYRIIVLMPLFYSQYISIMSVEQMHNGMLYAVWSIPVAIALVVIGSIISHKAFSKHQVR